MGRVVAAEAVAAELVPLMRAELELCHVAPDEVVAIHSDAQSPPAYAAALMGAALALAAHPFQIQTVARDADETVGRAWEASDLIVDLRTAPGTGATALAKAALEAGRRVLAITEPADVLRRLFPDVEVLGTLQAAAERLGGARSVQVTSRRGSVLRFSKEGRPGIDQHGFSEAPGRWDRWPSCRVVCAPLEESAEGRLVVVPGDLWLSLGRYAERPVILTFAGGRLVGVEGEGADVVLLRDWLANPPDDSAPVLAGFSWGADPRARWDRMALRSLEPGGVMEAASRDGAIMVIFGDNTSPMLDGRNRTAARFAVALRDHSVAVDGLTVVRDGVFVRS